MSICYHFRHDHESSSFRKLGVHKWICRKIFDYYLGIYRNRKTVGNCRRFSVFYFSAMCSFSTGENFTTKKCSFQNISIQTEKAVICFSVIPL